MTKRYYKDNNGVREWYNGFIVVDDMQIINPSPEMLSAAGWTEYVAPVYTPTEQDNISAEIADLKQRLADSDYIAIKAFEGEDVTQYGDWKAERHALRVRINELEQLNG